MSALAGHERTRGGRRSALATVATLAALVSFLLPARAFGAVGPRCVPAQLNASDVVPGTTLSVSPLPGSYDASPETQISMLGLPASALSGVTVTGSQSGAHPGSLRPYSQGDGASFVPAAPFQQGERVTVLGRAEEGGESHVFTFSFIVAQRDVLPVPVYPHPYRDPNEKQHFHSRPDLEPPAVVVTAHSPQASPGLVFANPANGPGQAGPMIFDEAGNLVWFDPIANGEESTNLQVQQLDGRPVLTWWQGYVPPQGFGVGEEIVDDTSYHQLLRVRAGNGYRADLHDFHITTQSTALLTVFNPVYCDLAPYGGPAYAAVTDGVFQEIDLHTGLVRREWHSLDHVPLSASYNEVRGASTVWPFDYFHINSIDATSDGTTLVSARNTWAVYELASASGQVQTTIGGRYSNVALAPGTATAFQHDAELSQNGTITIFDNGGTPKVHGQSRGIVVSINGGAKSGSLLAEFVHPSPPLLSSSQGDMQLLPNGDAFIGWGSQPYFSEFSSSGALLFDAHMHGSYGSYRAYRFPWTGTPAYAPSIVAAPAAHGAVTVYVSWNGDTRTSTWRVLAGSNPHRLHRVASAARTGFETAITTPGPAPYVAVHAIGPAGEGLGSSGAIRG